MSWQTVPQPLIMHGMWGRSLCGNREIDIHVRCEVQLRLVNLEACRIIPAAECSFPTFVSN